MSVPHPLATDANLSICISSYLSDVLHQESSTDNHASK